MKHSSKEYRRKKALNGVLSTLSASFVVVEGRHDVSALRRLGIASHTCEQVLRSAAPPSGRVLILTDNDRRGLEKAQALKEFLSDHGVRADEATGPRLLKLLGTDRVEEIIQPMAQALQTEDTKQKIGDIYGENIFGHSKVHGRGEVLDQRHGRQA